MSRFVIILIGILLRVGEAYSVLLGSQSLGTWGKMIIRSDVGTCKRFSLSRYQQLDLSITRATIPRLSSE